MGNVLTHHKHKHAHRWERPFRVVSSSLLVLALLVGCGTPYSAWSFQKERRDADKLVDQGQYQAALEAYTALSKKAEVQQDLQYLEYRSALMKERLGDADGALRAYAQIYTRAVHPYDEYAARAMYRAGRVYADMLDQQDLALEVWLNTVKEFPNTTYAESALDRVTRSYTKNDDYEGALNILSSLYTDLYLTELGQKLVYDAAQILDEDLDRCHDAIVLYELIENNYPRSGLVDNAIWQTALCYRAHDEIDQEETILTDFVASREESVIVGDYNYAQYNPAMKRLAHIQEERHDYPAAIKAWRRFQTTFPFSLDNPEISYRIIELYAELGDVRHMRKYHKEMKKLWPDSRFVGRAEALIKKMEERR